MFEDILIKTYYGNTIRSWLFALIIMVASFLIGKILYWVSGNIIKKFTAKTETKIDDIIIDMVEEPLVFALTLIGIWYALDTLTLGVTAHKAIAFFFQFAIIFNIAWLVVRLFDSLFKEYLVPLAEKSETDLDDQLLPILRKGTKFIVWSLALVIALNNAGYDVGALIAGLGIGGLAFALAAQDTVSNIFGGFTVFTDQPFKLNERVKVDGIDGFIREIGLRSTRIETLEGRMVTVPNSTFSKNAIENISVEPSRKIVLNLGLTYDTKPLQMEKAMTILKNVSDSMSDQIISEKTLISFTSFGDFSLGILYIYYIQKTANILDTQTSINMEILKQFNKAKIEFAFPTQTIYSKKG